MVIHNTESSWEQLLEVARDNTSARRLRRPGQSPSTVPIASSLHKLPTDTAPPVVLYRDTNSWCPFCERVWFALEEKEIPFATEFIDLFNKPKWYTDLVPTGLVPAVKIEDQFVHESKAILLALEEQFGITLLPDNLEENAIARQWIEEAETGGLEQAGYKFLLEKTSEADGLVGLQAAFEAKLDELEQALGQYPGPYFLSTFSLVDITYSPHLDRLAATLPVYRDYSIKGNPRFPRISAWFVALAERPAYHRVKSEDITNNLLFRRFWGAEPIANLVPPDPAISHTLACRAEAAERLSDNHELAIADILKNSGLQAFSGETSALETAIESHLKLLATYLLYGEDTLLPWGRIGGKDQSDPFASAVGAIALTYVRNRICAPRDMSAGAAIAFRAAVDRLLTSLY
ncbi:glutathione S-transferase family protein [Leptolyngbya sp. FACHB-261]|uniref:glutathione S-transferase family protein n=1 Tax=Leptolyngbya sp. FACHB-261 TaxID=2692806 RepID=UPI001688B5C5|nr:glutathione S-transferase family protein [Leptolyngbya sp. FACHB-261]MBD2100407.1 glutathione S-transferase N-terminal domain-containing protein [Leptolyngbya sp. FACHB-261]